MDLASPLDRVDHHRPILHSPQGAQWCDPRASDRHDRKVLQRRACQSHGRNPPGSGPTEMRPLVINVVFCAGALGFALGIVQAIRSPPMKEQPAKPAEKFEDRLPAAMTLTPKVVRPQMVRPQIVTPQESPPTIPAAPQTALAPPVMTTPIQAPVSVTTIATADGSGAFIERRHGYDGLCEKIPFAPGGLYPQRAPILALCQIGRSGVIS